MHESQIYRKKSWSMYQRGEMILFILLRYITIYLHKKS